jgi:hypothetical protein
VFIVLAVVGCVGAVESDYESENITPIKITERDSLIGTSKINSFLLSCDDGTQLQSYASGMRFNGYVGYDGFYFFLNIEWTQDNTTILNENIFEVYNPFSPYLRYQTQLDDYRWKVTSFRNQLLGTYCDFEILYQKISDDILQIYLN